MPALAITGGIATGKSTFTRLFADAVSAPTFDTDACARRLLESDADALAALRAEFGPRVFDPAGRVDRSTLREIVFAEPVRRRALENILHPRVRQAWQGWLESRLQSDPSALCVVEIPLLYETGAAKFFEKVIVVGCSFSRQRHRLTASRGLSDEMARQIIASQTPLAEKISQCHHLIWNDGSEAGLRAQVALLTAYFLSGAASLGRPRDPAPDLN